MIDDKLLNIDEILCLQLMGYKTHEILRADLDYFDRLYDGRQEEMDWLLDKADAILDRQEKAGVKTLIHYDARFPKQLKAIGDDCPPLIHLLGNLDLLSRNNFTAIIGARNCDKRGFDVAYKLGVEYAKRGDVIVSGLALGCDAAAHQGCLAAGGETIAIVGNGLDITHPRENGLLQKLILQNGGLLMSEQPFGIKANPTRLVARNRLQAAISQKVIVAQCPEHSGTMHTVRFTQKYGKKIFAATYPLYNETNSGNKLLLDQQIAKPVKV